MKGILGILLLWGLAPGAFAAVDLPVPEDAGCREGPVGQFGAYLGDWLIENESLMPDGRTWQAGKGARWIFVCVGNGIAVQDFWLDNQGGTGTNLRIYNPERKLWEIAWTSNNTPGMMHIEAELEPATGNIVMQVISPAPPQPRRIVFFPVEDNRWRWQQERSFDGGNSYIPVARMKARRNGG